LRRFEANEAKMVELQTERFHMRSQFLTKSGESAPPMAQPPVSKILLLLVGPI